jgi:ADP-ribose pyrophosphatase YjhB (NUDIX family)
MGGDLGDKPSSLGNRLMNHLNIFLVSVIFGLCLFIHKTRHPTSSGACLVSFGAYHGHVYSSQASGTAGPSKCLVESKWMKVQQHKVKLPGTSSVIDDWLWIDYHDRINVLVEAPRKATADREFLVFEQSKYALEGRTSKAIIGGIIEPGEEPEQAAIREVEEEMGMLCTQFHFLGRFRTDVNRGMGWVNSFLATQCSKKAQQASASTGGQGEEEVGAADTEKQDMKTISLEELRRAAVSGEFLEVQWSATVAMALLHTELS